jgi:hypothetical protein
MLFSRIPPGIAGIKTVTTRVPRNRIIRPTISNQGAGWENFACRGAFKRNRFLSAPPPQSNVPAYVSVVANAYKGAEAMVPHYFFSTACRKL